MAFLSIPNVRVVGVSAGVPRFVERNLNPSENIIISEEYSVEEFVAQTGVEERRISKTLTASDLCYAAAERLVSDLKWEKSEIQALIFVSQTTDYIAPATSCILQNRLGLSKECLALDVSLGCSGWVYGLSVLASLCSRGSIKKALLLAGDGKQWSSAPIGPLFGFAGTATAIEYDENSKDLRFELGTDGSGYDALIVPDGGSRNGVSEKSFDLECVDGKMLHRLQSRMKGMDVFSFGISTAPKSVKKLADYYSFDYLDFDYFIFHQANLKMNQTIIKKLKLPEEKVPSCMRFFGNTSSASIPLTIVAELRNKLSGVKKLLCCGFGIGLSWGTVAVETEHLFVSNLVEVDENKESLEWV